MGLKAAVQALKKAEPLKDKVQHCKDLLNDNDAWVCQRQLQKIYQQVLILDLEYALDRKVEQELWNLGFKNYIALLQSQAKDRRNPKRGESQAMLSWCLEAASGFYLTLLQEICTAFNLDLPFRRKSYIYGCTSPWKAVEKLSAPHKSSCFYACQYCLVHLGDIARYRNQNKQAELFYRHAVSLSPSSGQPYNQLALLEASRGDKLGTVFHYVRSVALKHPFPVASANLSKTLSSALNDNSFNVKGKTKLSSQEYIAVFLKLHGILYNLGDLSVATTYVKLLTDTLTALVATESFNSWRLVQMLIINLFTLQHMAGMLTENTDLIKDDQLSTDEKISRNCILDLIAGSLSALLLPVYTIKNAIIDYFALPTIKLCLDWIQQRPTVLEEGAFTSRLQIWPSLCVLLNGLQSCVADFDYNHYAKTPLPEDRDLQGFLPLEKSFELLKFTNTDLDGDIIMLNKLRASRILQLGRQISQHQINGINLLSLNFEDQIEEQKFVSIIEATGLSNELIKELEELSLNKEKQLVIANSPVLSETASSKGSSEIDSLISDFCLEKRGGILKPQSSFERNRDSNDPVTIVNPLPSSTRKPRQNVAMQAIMRRAENEQKQVTFKNVSPVIIEEGNKSTSVSTNPITIIASTISPTKTNRDTNLVVSTSATNKTSSNSVSNLSVIQPRPPLMPKMPLVIHSNPASIVQQLHQPKLQTQQLQQQIPSQLQQSLSDQQLKQQQQSENLQLPLVTSQFPLVDLQTLTGLSPPGLAQFPQQQQQQQQQHHLSSANCYSNQSFNIQTPQFHKNFIPNPAASLQQYTVATSVPGQFCSSQSQASSTTPFPSNVNIIQSGLLQPQQQRNNFAAFSQSKSILTQRLNLSPSTQQKQQQTIGQNIGLTMQQNPLSIHPQNLLTSTHCPVNGLNLQNHINISVAPASLATTCQGNLSETTAASTAVTSNIQSLNYSGSNFSQNNFAQLQQQQQKNMNATTYDSGHQQQQQFTFSNATTSNKNQQHQQQQQQHSINNYPIFQSYDTKDYSPWKDSQSSEPPAIWWGNSNVPAGQSIQQQDHNKDLVSSSTDTFQTWDNSANSSSKHANNVSLTSGHNYQQNLMQGHFYDGRTNLEDIRSFNMDQKQQSTAIGSTYSLFSGNTWGMNSQLTSSNSLTTHNQQDQLKTRLNQQSLWSGPGPSPLERLLEQQKSLREGGT